MEGGTSCFGCIKNGDRTERNNYKKRNMMPKKPHGKDKDADNVSNSRSEGEADQSGIDRVRETHL